MLTYVLVSLTSWITAVKPEHDGNMTLEFPTMLLSHINKKLKNQSEITDLSILQMIVFISKVLP